MPPSTPEVFLDLWKRYWEKSKIRDCFMVKFNQINMEQMFLFFVSTKRMHIDSFARKAFNRCPPPQYSRKNFGPIKEILEKNRKSGIVLWSNSIKPTWNIMFLFFVSTKRMHIDNFVQNAFNRCPPVLQKSFWTYERDIGKSRKSGIVLWSNSIKSTWNKCFFSSFPQKRCILIVSLRRLSIGAPSTAETILDL